MSNKNTSIISATKQSSEVPFLMQVHERFVSQNKFWRVGNKKGQVGETVTWFIATIVIVLILTFFTFGASYLAQSKNLLDYSKSAFSKATYEGDDIYLKKTIYSQLISDSRRSVQISKYVNKRSEAGEFELDPEVTLKKIRDNLNKK